MYVKGVIWESIKTYDDFKTAMEQCETTEDIEKKCESCTRIFCNCGNKGYQTWLLDKNRKIEKVFERNEKAMLEMSRHGTFEIIHILDDGKVNFIDGNGGYYEVNKEVCEALEKLFRELKEAL